MEQILCNFWAIILALVVSLASVNTISENRAEIVERESRRFIRGHPNPKHGSFNTNYNNRMDSGFKHPSGLRGPLLPNENNLHHKNNDDLSASAQTLYDLRGFHIPLGGQEETQRFLRQQNHVHLDHQTTPLVFPSFFQPQLPQDHETQPQAINIFGHNQHHQQTHRFRSPEINNRFRPSKPDLGVTTTTENVFHPVQPIETLQLQELNPTAATLNNEEDIFVYDDADYQLEQEQTLPKNNRRQPTIDSAGVRRNQAINTIETSTLEPERRHNVGLKRFKLNGLPSGTQNTLFEQDKKKNYNLDNFESQNENDIGKQPFRPNVEIVPSSERKPPEHVDTISPPIAPSPQDNRLIIRSHKRGERFPEKSSRPTAPLELAVQRFSVLKNERPNFFGQLQPEGLNINGFQRNRNPQNSPNERNRHQLEEPFHELIREPEEKEFFKYDQDLIQKLNPYLTQERFRPSQRLRPVYTTLPQIYLDSPPPTQFFDEEKMEEQEPVKISRTTTTTTPPPPTKTTEIQKKTELKSIRPFTIRNRIPTLSALTTIASTTTAPKRRNIRPRIRHTTLASTTATTITTTTPLQEKVRAHYSESSEIETPKFIATQGETLLTIRSRDSPLLRSRTTSSPVKKTNQELIFHRERKFNYETPSSPSQRENFPQNSLENIFVPHSRSDSNIFNPRFRNEFDQDFSVFKENSPEIYVQHGRNEQQLLSNQPSLRQPVSPMFSGKPLYVTGKMLATEGGLYAGQIIPPGHSYGIPISLIPINNVFEQTPNILAGQVVFQKKRISLSPSSIRQKPHTSGSNENNGVSSQLNALRSNAQEIHEKSPVRISQQTQRTRTRPLLRRKYNLNSQSIRDKPPNEVLARGTDTKVLLNNINDVPSDQPPTINPRRRKKRPRKFPTNSTTSKDQSITLRQLTQSPKIRPRIRQRPTSLNTLQSLASESQTTPPSQVNSQSSVQIFRRPTEAPGRFSSRYRGKNILVTPAPTQPSITQAKTNPQEPVDRKRGIKVPKSFKIDSPTRQVISTMLQPKVKVRAKVTEVEDVLPASIYLSSRDVLTNRKPARRIPPGSYSDKIKALQTRRRTTTLKGALIQENPINEIQSNPENEDDEIYYQSSNIEQVQNKREIYNRHKTSGTSLKFEDDVPALDSKTELILGNSTRANSDETLSVLEILNGTRNSQKDQIMPVSLENEMVESPLRKNVKSISDSFQGSTKEDKKVFDSLYNNDMKYLTKSRLHLFTMSTEEPSLPLESYFPIVSQK